MNAERLLEQYEKIADAPNAIDRLRVLILDLAVRGKLVPQVPAEEPAKELLARAKNAKQTIRNARGIGRNEEPELSKSAGEVTSPTHWAWAHLSDFALVLGGKRLPSGAAFSQTPTEHIYIRITDMKNGTIIEEGIKFISSEVQRQISKYTIDQDDIYVTIAGTIGEVGRVPFRFHGHNLTENAAKIVFREIDRDFLMLTLQSDDVQNQFADKTNRVAQPKLALKRILGARVPVPPLSEQHRIVAKVDELMALCDQLEAARAAREATRDRLAAASLARLNTPDAETFADDAHFALDALPALTARPDQIKQLRQTILNLAVRGKLVPQDPKDEPAEELLKRIAEERDELVKSKVIRRDGLLDPVLATEHPFAIPATWSWARIGDVVHFTQYGTSQKSHPSEKGVPVLTMGNVQDGRVVWSNEKRIPEDSSDLPDLYLRKYDLLYNRTNSAELVGKTGIYIGEDRKRTFASYLIRLRPSLRWSAPHFINLAMNTSVFRETQIVPLIKKQTGQANVNGSALKNMLVPLPPLAEQHRIIAKVDELTSLCDRLETSLTTADDTRRELLDALLAEALAPVNAEHLQEAAE